MTAWSSWIHSRNWLHNAQRSTGSPNIYGNRSPLVETKYNGRQLEFQGLEAADHEGDDGTAERSDAETCESICPILTFETVLLDSPPPFARSPRARSWVNQVGPLRRTIPTALHETPTSSLVGESGWTATPHDPHTTIPMYTSPCLVNQLPSIIASAHDHVITANNSIPPSACVTRGPCLRGKDEAVYDH